VTTGTARLRSHDVFAVVICVLAAAFWINYNCLQFKHFGYMDWDLALYAQVVGNICHGSCRPSLWGMNFLGNHSEYIAFLAAPVYCLFHHPLTLVVLNVLLFMTGAYILYLIARSKLGSLPGLAILAAYLICPANYYMLSFEFHFESFAPCFIFLAYYFFERNRLRPFLIACLVLCLIKENMPTIVVMFGLVAVFVKKENRWLWCLAPIVMGGAVFFLDLFVLIPYFHQTVSQSVYWGLYQQYGHTPAQIAGNMAANPFKLVQDIFSQNNQVYLLDLFGPYVIPAVFSPQILVLGLPIFLQNLLSSAWTNHTIYFHYAATLVPFIMLATVHGLSAVRRKVKPAVFLTLVSVLLVAGIGHANWESGLLVERMSTWDNSMNEFYRTFLKKVPRGEPVIASFAFLSHLTERPELYSFHYLWNGTNTLSGVPFVLPAHVRIALLDFDESSTYAEFAESPVPTASRISREFLDNGWTFEDAMADLVLLRKNNPEGRKLVEVLPVASPVAIKVELDPQIALADLKTTVRCSSPQECRLEIRFDWLSRAAQQSARAIRLDMTRGGKRVYSTEHIPGYMIYPPVLWKPNEIVREYFILQLPSGRYDLQIGLIPVVFVNGLGGQRMGRSARKVLW
jgi:uncharacterized membrane protein